MEKIRTIDLFAGCGGLTEGFLQSGKYETKACVEWDLAACQNLRKHLHDKWKMNDSEERVIRFDIQRTKELINGFSDQEYGKSVGLNKLTNNEIDMVIGGPPCQAYSIAGRIRDKNGMKDDYRNFLFESYLKIVEKYQPKAFVFENVPGILSATPGDQPIIQLIYNSFLKAGYIILKDLHKALIDISLYGVPQRRKRIIILGLKKSEFGENAEILLNKFYNDVLPSYKAKREVSVKEAIGDLPKLFPLPHPTKHLSHNCGSSDIKNHTPRYHNERDIDIFRSLARDIELKEFKYISTEAKKKLYTEKTGFTSNIHKYNILQWDKPSNTIPAHLNKDGLRHIHPDSQQARSITVREAARLQSFPDDYEFIGAKTDQYRMIGNAVPPEFARRLALAIYDLLYVRNYDLFL